MSLYWIYSYLRPAPTRCFACTVDSTCNNFSCIIKLQALMCHSLQGDAHLFSCPDCDIVLPLRALKVHITRLHPLKLMQCQFCDKSFKSRCRLVEHERVHSGVRPFECLVCGARLKAKKHLSKHSLLHARTSNSSWLYWNRFSKCEPHTSKCEFTAFV